MTDMRKSRSLAQRAVELAELMSLSGKIGSAVRIEPDGGVSLVDPSQGSARRIGSSVPDAVRHLKRIVGTGRLHGGHHGAQG